MIRTKMRLCSTEKIWSCRESHFADSSSESHVIKSLQLSGYSKATSKVKNPVSNLTPLTSKINSSQSTTNGSTLVFPSYLGTVHRSITCISNRGYICAEEDSNKTTRRLDVKGHQKQNGTERN